jgi:hypothetical protein
MDKSQLHEYWLFLVISLSVAVVLILGFVARILWEASHGVGRLPNRWIPTKLRHWLLGETEPKPRH